MLRMDLLLNPGSPLSSPAREPIDYDENQNGFSKFYDAGVEHIPHLVERSHDANDKAASPSDVDGLPAHQRWLPASKTPDSPSTVPAIKRLKRDLPALRLLLESGADNQRDDPPHEIFSGHAFWGKVASLNPVVSSPSDVSDPGTTSASTSAAASAKPARIQPRVSFVRELESVPLMPSLPLLALVATAKVQISASHSADSLASSADDESPSTEADGVTTDVTTPSSKSGKKKKITICKEDGCSSQALSKHLCMKHGGGPRCSAPGCDNGAKLRNLCFQHGGSTICLTPTCSSKAKRFGYCWSHGGGRICGEDECNKVAAQGGMCWAHGGGNRCKLPGCTKRSYKQHGYFCKRHAEVSADY